MRRWNWSWRMRSAIWARVGSLVVMARGLWFNYLDESSSTDVRKCTRKVVSNVNIDMSG